MRERLFTKSPRIKARNLACDCFDKAGGNVEAAYEMAVKRKGEVGSILLMLTIGALVLQAIYYAMKIWQSLNLMKSPILPVPGEGFELGLFEAYALTPSERRSIVESRRENK